MVIARTEVLHEPKLDTILMVEKSIIDVTEYPTRTELWIACPGKCNTKPSSA